MSIIALFGTPYRNFSKFAESFFKSAKPPLFFKINEIDI